MDPLHLCIALTPLAAYLLFLAMLNFGTRPRVLSGIRDSAAIALGIIGLAIAGPLELFLPESAAFRFGPFSWMMMLILYLLAAALIILSMRPRLVIYNTTIEELRPILTATVEEMDQQSRWAGDSVAMPESGIHMHMDANPSMRNVQLMASGSEEDYTSWSKLHWRLHGAFRKTSGRVRNQNAALFLMLAMMLFFIVIRSVIQDHETMASALKELLRM